VKPITWLRKFRNRGDRGHPIATLAFYGPDDTKASKAVLGIQPDADTDFELHKWFRDSPEADLRYDIKLQNTWIEIIRREGVRSLAMMEEIFGCPHEEGIDYPVGEVCPECPFWADRPRPVPKPATRRAYTAIASFKPEQWQELLATADDRDELEKTWEEWNARVESLTKKLSAHGIPFVRVVLDVDQINQYCKEHGVPNNGDTRSKLAIIKGEEEE
jgi:hypothetical protein